MPKKPPRNAYYYFMLDFKEEQRNKGIHYKDLGEVQQAADPSWRSMPQSERAKYEQMAKREKEKTRGSEQKFTSNGVPISVIESRQRMEQEIEEIEVDFIKNFIRSKGLNKAIYEEDIYLIDVNTYCATNKHFLLAEMTVLRFNLRDGIRDLYHENINPGHIPTGYMSDVKIGASEKGLDMPDDEKEATNYLVVLANIMDYLKQQNGREHLPPLYTMPDKVVEVKDFVLQLCQRAIEDESKIRVYKLDTLLYYLANEIKTTQDEGYPKTSLANVQLKKDVFRYTPKLACDHHEGIDKPIECTSSRVKRWAFTIMDKCCLTIGIEPVPGKHVPRNIDIEGVITYKEMKKQEVKPRGTASYASSACSMSVCSEALESAPPSIISEKSKTQKRVHVPLRMPKSDFSQDIHAPPELSEGNFPALSAGRGRGLARNLNKMSLNK